MAPEVAVYGVVGRPILQSRSPALFRRWFPPGMRPAYLAILVRDLDSLERLWRRVPLSGFNVTRPWKEAMASLGLLLDRETEQTRAVNLVFRDPRGRWWGTNTDAPAVRRVLDRQLPGWRGRRAVVLGAGGAARAVAWTLYRGQCPTVVLNRTPDRAIGLARDFGMTGVGLDRLGDWLPGADLVVSTLPPEATADLALTGVRPGTPLLDAAYLPSPLWEQASRLGLRLIPGTEWLIEQARLTHRRWFGSLPPPGSERQVIEETSAPVRRVALVGFMGSGKTTLGQEMARALGWAFVDLDREVEGALGATPAEIFSGPGEEAFREVEEQTLRARSRQDRVVVACGGGTTLRSTSRALLRERFLVLWAFASLPVVADRVGNGWDRPLWSRDPDRVEELWRARQPGYARCADLLVDTEAGDARSLAREIAREMDSPL